MKIAFVSYEYPPDTGKGGIGTYINQIAAALTGKNWEIHIFSGTFGESYHQRQLSCNIYRIKCSSPLDFREKVVEIFSAEHALKGFDLIESPEIHGNAWEIKKKFPSIPLVVRLHAGNYMVENLKKRYVPLNAKLRFFAGALKKLKWDLGYWRKYNRNRDPDFQFTILADGITAPSVAMKNWAVNNWHIEQQKITVIPNIFVPSAALLTIPVRNDYNINKIIFFGRLNVLKGLVNATRAKVLILREHPDWHFTVIGDDGPGAYGNKSMRQWMQQRLKLFSNRVSFFNGVNYDDLPAAITDSSIVVLPSLFESFSYTCIEAMAAGKAVVGSNNAGMVDIIQNEKNGLLVNPENYREIYKAIKKLIIDPSLRHRLSLEARATASNSFTRDTLEMSMEYYRQISQGVHG